jgi:putative NIF3 family GTP cyclohydrolase 1 type 2
MPAIRFEASCPSGGATSAIDARIEDVRLAVSLLVGAASKAEEAIASTGIADREATHWAPESLAAAGPLGKIIKASIELEATLAGRHAVSRR